jgi:hypothetical protein
MLCVPRLALRAASAPSKVRWDSLLAAIGRVPCEYYRVPCEYYLGHAASRPGARLHLCAQRSVHGTLIRTRCGYVEYHPWGAHSTHTGEMRRACVQRSNANPISAGLVTRVTGGCTGEREERVISTEAEQADEGRRTYRRRFHRRRTARRLAQARAVAAQVGPACLRTRVTAHDCRHTRSKSRVAGPQRPCVPLDHSEYPGAGAHTTPV